MKRRLIVALLVAIAVSAAVLLLPAPSLTILPPPTPLAKVVPPPVLDKPAPAPTIPEDVPFYGFCPDKNAKHAFIAPPSLEKLRNDPAFADIAEELDDASAASEKRDFKTTRELLQRALEKHPHEPALSFYFGTLAVQTPDLAAASDALADYLRAYPKDVNTAQLLARVGTQREIEADDLRVDDGVVSLRFPPEVASRASQIAAAITRAIDDAADWTGTTPRNELAAVVYRDRSELLASSCMAAWSGGFFDGTIRLIDSKNILQVARHETFHAQLASAVDRIPSWFTEGAAQYFSGERVKDHPGTFKAMVDNHTYIPFASLHGTFQSFDEDSAASMAYEESLALVQMAISERGDVAMRDAVSALKAGKPADVWQKMSGESEDDLLRFLARELAD